MDGVGDSKPRHKKRASHSTQKNSDDGDCPPNANENLVILSSVGGDDIEETSNDKEEEISTSNDEEEEISVNESTEFSENDLFNELYGKTLHNVEVEVEDVQYGQQRRDKSGRLENNELCGKSLHHDKVEDEGVQDVQQHRDKSGGLEERQHSGRFQTTMARPQRPGEQHLPRADWDALMSRRAARINRGQASDKDTDESESQQLHSPGKTGEETLSKSQRKRLRKKERDKGKRNRDQEEDQEGDHDSNRNYQEEDSAKEVDKQRENKKKRKRQSSDGI
jgi:hypothetical protein